MRHYEELEGSRGRFLALAAALRRRELSIEDALTIAQSHTDVAASEAQEVLDVAWAMMSRQTELVQVLNLLDIIVAALRARRAGAACDEQGRYACLLFGTLARAHLLEVADGRVFRRAVRAVEDVIDWAQAVSDEPALADALACLGRLRLDPWTYQGRVFDPEREIGRWEADFRVQFRNEIADVDEVEWRMPPIRDAVRAAVVVYERALTLQTGTERGSSLAACASAGVIRLALGDDVDQPEVVARCREALILLQSGDRASELVIVLSLLSWLREPVQPAELQALLDASLDHHVQHLGWSQASTVISHVVAAIAPADPRTALELARSARLIFERAAHEHEPLHETLQNAYLTNEISLLIEAHVGREDHLICADADVAARAEALRAAAARDNWEVRRLAANLLRLTRETEAFTRVDSFALELFAEVWKLAPVLVSDHETALLSHHARLLVHVGHSAGRDGLWESAAWHLAEAISASASFGLRHEALGALTAVGDIIALMRARSIDMAAAAGAISPILRAVASASAWIEVSLGAGAQEQLQEIYADTIGVLANHPNDAQTPQVVVLLLQLAKGMQFGMQLHRGSRHDWHEDDDGAELLRQIASEQANDDDAGASGVDEELLVSYVRPERNADNEGTARLAGLRSAYEVHLESRLRPDPALEIPLLTCDALQGLLGARTVLVDFYLQARHGADLGVVAVALTSDDSVLTVQSLQIPAEVHLRAAARGWGFPSSPFAPLVARLRADLHRSPEPDAVTASAAEALRDHGKVFFGGLSEHLDRWAAAGKDHLCICPHGPLHMHPLHLCGTEAPLAADWIVTYLPNHFMVLPRSSDALWHRPTMQMRAFGLSYEQDNRFGLSTLPEARREARDVAATFATHAQVDHAVTERAVLEALGQAEYVHLAAHGRHSVASPSFQCLYLAPEGTSDGRLEAHELLLTDMRGTRVLTLSACETSLGRFDAADNLRGLPAAFLLAGVRTVIGTLWPVNSNASRAFFTHFYSELRTEAPLLDAFALAQRATRQEFPAYRDWGPFQLIGDWV